MDESRRLAMRRAHTKHVEWCSCGNVVCGNGGRASHRYMHERKGDGHHGVGSDEWWKRVADGQITPIKNGAEFVKRRKESDERMRSRS